MNRRLNLSVHHEDEIENEIDIESEFKFIERNLEIFKAKGKQLLTPSFFNLTFSFTSEQRIEDEITNLARELHLRIGNLQNYFNQSQNSSFNKERLRFFKKQYDRTFKAIFEFIQKKEKDKKEKEKEERKNKNNNNKKYNYSGLKMVLLGLGTGLGGALIGGPVGFFVGPSLALTATSSVAIGAGFGAATGIGGTIATSVAVSGTKKVVKGIKEREVIGKNKNSIIEIKEENVSKKEENEEEEEENIEIKIKDKNKKNSKKEKEKEKKFKIYNPKTWFWHKK